jgi:N-acyl homoserine lactone hydrolase
MTRALRLWPLLTGTHRYEKVVSTRNRGHGEFIDAPILAYLIETSNGRILYDVGCDYRKIATPELRAAIYVSRVMSGRSSATAVAAIRRSPCSEIA